LFGDLVEGGKITISIKDDDLDFVVTPLPKPLTKAERKALKQKSQEAKELNDQITDSQEDKKEVL
jgi:hypothetical protein